jgi:hypothetical protein
VTWVKCACEGCPRWVDPATGSGTRKRWCSPACQKRASARAVAARAGKWRQGSGRKSRKEAA